MRVTDNRPRDVVCVRALDAGNDKTLLCLLSDRPDVGGGAGHTSKRISFATQTLESGDIHEMHASDSSSSAEMQR